eukprot:1160229-Pelagomonas_calceolata.AAC.5
MNAVILWLRITCSAEAASKRGSTTCRKTRSGSHKTEAFSILQSKGRRMSKTQKNNVARSAS